MDQQDWNRIYTDLENDVEAQTKREGTQGAGQEIYVQIDRARFAIDKGENARAIEIIEDIKRRLAGTAPGAGAELRRGGPALPSIDKLDALEDRLLAETRFATARLEVVGEAEVVLPPGTRSASLNTKVNKSIKFEDIQDEYVAMFNSAKIRPEKLNDVRWYSNKVLAGRGVYEEIEARTNVPWYFVGTIHGMECSYSMAKHLHNGDSLNARTWQVPKGRPKEGNPPFTFLDSACDALAYDNLAGQRDWTLALMLHRLEVYNGFGYRRKFGTASPYLWSYSNHFTSGKYVQDGVYDPNATSKQCGAAVMLKDLVERGIVSFDAAGAAKPVTVPAPGPAPQPAPVAQPAPAPAPAPAAQPAPAPTPPAAAQPGTAPAPGSTVVSDAGGATGEKPPGLNDSPYT
jgi:lysozyme family protein